MGYTNRVYLKPRPPGFKLHSYYSEFLVYPIPRWRVLAPVQTNDSGHEVFRLFHVALQTSPVLWNLSNNLIPTLARLTYPFSNRSDRLEQVADVTYCANHAQTKSARWVADFEHIAALTGYYDPGLAARWLGRKLQQSSCKALFCWSKKAMENSKLTLGHDLPIEKCHVVYPATSAGPIPTETRKFDGKVRICHVTTHRTSQLENIANFYVKGTRDLLLLLKLMSRTTPKLLKKMTVIIRGWCPPSYVEKLRALGVEIELIERTLSRPEALSLLAESDLSLIPCHSTPTMAFIEAMSRSLPVITNDVWANCEYLADHETGFLIEPPKGIRYFDRNLTPQWYRPGFTQSVKTSVDTAYLMRHMRQLEYILEDENFLLSLRVKTGQYFERSPFEVGSRNRELGLLLDGALN